ncbi:hypothetical protein C8F04DRAFT_1200691 [Mycena alexandri]|uniref:Uncharacterized protein n=1 Tax=Mycena alexandri TaxID=1745969 RepID=A0AAD6RXV0_9AGAR|nr:hypothetical protein C8F04DRAFT_1200691 [Mycena alexandri]
MAKCHACGQSCQPGRGLTNHYNRCEVLKAQRAATASHVLAVDAAAAEEAAAALAAPPAVPAEAVDNDIRPDSPIASPPNPLPPGRWPSPPPHPSTRTIPRRATPVPTAVNIPAVPREPSPAPADTGDAENSS